MKTKFEAAKQDLLVQLSPMTNTPNYIKLRNLHRPVLIGGGKKVKRKRTYKKKKRKPKRRTRKTKK